MNRTMLQEIAILGSRAGLAEAQEFVDNTAPSGSGLDSGIEVLKVTDTCVEFQADFHHMNDVGYYDGWTQHRVKVTPSLTNGFNIKISGKNKNEIKDYLYDIFYHYLNKSVNDDPTYGNGYFNFNENCWVFSPKEKRAEAV